MSSPVRQYPALPGLNLPSLRKLHQLPSASLRKLPQPPSSSPSGAAKPVKPAKVARPGIPDLFPPGVVLKAAQKSVEVLKDKISNGESITGDPNSIMTVEYNKIKPS